MEEKTTDPEKELPTFEQGPIRPPSEARSLLLRVTRNCPWNRCRFCPVYKGSKFSLRSAEEVKSDISAMKYWEERVIEESWRLGFGGELDNRSLAAVYQRNAGNPFMSAILVWKSGGGKTAFLQDANSVIMRPGNLAEVLEFLRQTFPGLERVTTYARSQTLSKRTEDDLKLLRSSGLDRLHVGMESGSDRVLELVDKGSTHDMHVAGGQKALAADFQLSEYIMPGLGGRALSEEHALETARALNAINPHFIRIRSLGLRDGMPLYEDVKAGTFELLNDEEMAREIRLLIENLSGISSKIVSDHILNLLPEVEGKLPEDKDNILAAIDRFLELDPERRLQYVVGRRFGLMEDMSDLEDRERAEAARRALAKVREAGGDDVHQTIREIVSRFI
ncbi:MAG: radical SAM protein [bacterium]